MSTIIRMPEVLANTSEASIQTWLVKLGDQIAVGSPLAEVETEKAVVEYAAETGGTVLELLVAEGDQIAVGEPIAIVGVAGEEPTASAAPPAAAPAPPASPAAEAAVNAAPGTAPEPETAPEAGAAPLTGLPTQLPPAAPDASANASAEPVPERDLAGSGSDGGRLFVSPIVRRLARERGLDLSLIEGTGPGGRIVRRDLDAFAATEPAGSSSRGSGSTPLPEPSTSVASVPTESASGGAVPGAVASATV